MCQSFGRRVSDMNKVTEIVTHDGEFHADDVFAVAVLKMVFPDASVFRTRNPEMTKPKSNRVIVDVGGQFDKEKNAFDHHQKVGSPEPRESGIKYSGFGLVWKTYGHCYLFNVSSFSKSLHNITSVQTNYIWEAIEKSLVSMIDATDNGQKLTTTTKEFGEIYCVDIIDHVSNYNLAYFENQNKESQRRAFEMAVEFAEQVLFRLIVKSYGIVLAEDTVKAARDGSPLLVLENGAPWMNIVVKDMPEVLFVAYPVEDRTWMLQAVPPELGSFEKRKGLPEHWAGLRNDELKKVTRVDDAIFCHPNLFICGAETKEGILKLAQLAIGE